MAPASGRDVWHPQAVDVSVSSATLEAQCTTYVGSSVYPGATRGTTFTGSSGDTNALSGADVVRSGEAVWCVWTGGDPRATATMVVTGTREI